MKRVRLESPEAHITVIDGILALAVLPGLVLNAALGDRRAGWPGLRGGPVALDISILVDTFMSVDMRGGRMLKLFGWTRDLAVEFCDRCSRVCDPGCRRAALRERALLQAWRYGTRV